MSALRILAGIAAATACFSPVRGQSASPSYELVAEIGTADSDPRYMFGLVVDAAFGPAGQVYVVDALNAVVRSYDTGGKFLRSFGRKGEGPGEFRFPTRISVSPTTLTVFDSELRRASVFSHDGAHVETRSLRDLPATFDLVVPLRHGKWLGATTALRTGRPLLELAGQSRAVVSRLGPDARLTAGHFVSVFSSGSARADTIFRYDHGFIVTIGAKGVGSLPRYWGAGGSWAVAGDSLIALIDGFDGAVRLLRVGRDSLEQVRRGRIPIALQPLTHQHWEEVAAVVRRERGLAEDVVLLGPPHRAQLGEAVFADDGTLWMRRIAFDPLRTSGAGPAQYLVLPLDGRPQFSVTLPPSRSLRAVYGDLLLVHHRTELGVDVIGVWRAKSLVKPGA